MLKQHITPTLFLNGLKIYDVGEETEAVLNPKHPLPRFRCIVHFILSGKGFFELGTGEKYSLTKGNMFSIYGNESVSYYSDPTDPMHYYWIGFGGEDGETVLNDLGFSKSHPVCTLTDVKAVKNAFQSLLDAWQDKERYRFLAQFYSLIDTLKDKNTERAKVLYTEHDDLFKRAIGFMELNLHKNMKLSDLTEHLNVSRSHFTRSFTKRFGMPPYRYYLRIKLYAAESLLISSPDYPVSTIADILGFPDVYSFSKLFKQFFGNSPSVHRKTAILPKNTL